MSYQKKVNKCHSCANRKGCEEKNNPCTLYVKDKKKEETVQVTPTPADGYVIC